MQTIIFCICISIILTLSYNLVDLKKINFLSVFTYLIDVFIVSFVFYLSIKVINNFLEQPLNLIFIVLSFITIFLIYFSFLRKIIYSYFLDKKENVTNIEEYVLDKYRLNIKVSKGNFIGNIIFIPIINKILISDELEKNLKVEDLSNSIMLEKKISFGNFIYVLNYLIPAIIFYYAFTLNSQNSKTILIITAATSLVILKKVTSMIVFKIGLKTLKGKVNKDELIKSYTNYSNFRQKNSSKIEKIKQNILLKNKISMIEKTL